MSAVSRIEMARTFATFMHADQKYGDKEYITHLEDVVNIVANLGEDAIVAAYLHDVCEDTRATFDTITNIFGLDTYLCIQAVTDPEGFHNRKSRKKEAYFRLKNSSSDLAIVIKTADRLANVRNCVKTSNAGLLSMYRKEHNQFLDAVSRPGAHQAFLAEITELLKDP